LATLTDLAKTSALAFLHGVKKHNVLSGDHIRQFPADVITETKLFVRFLLWISV